MSRLNYHHLYYFWQVARDGKLTAVARRLHVSQSALSAQIRQLEDQLGMTLFERERRSLQLTPAGRRVLSYANDIFHRGEELEAWIRRGTEPEFHRLRIGVRSTMSRNFVDTLVAPLLARDDIRFSLFAGSVDRLLDDLSNHELDIVLTDSHVASNRDGRSGWQSQLLARQPLSILAPADRAAWHRFPDDMRDARWILPGPATAIRSAFDAFCAMHQFEPDVLAEADDMAMLRLLARDSGELSVLPSVVVKDEIHSGQLVELMRIPNAYEHFYAVTLHSRFSSTTVSELLTSFVLGAEQD